MLLDSTQNRQACSVAPGLLVLYQLLSHLGHFLLARYSFMCEKGKSYFKSVKLKAVTSLAAM